MTNKTSSKNFLIYGVLSITIILVVYYVPNYFLLETSVANHSAILLSLLGINAPVQYIGESVLIGNYAVIKDCTGIQVIAVFIGLILPLPKVSVKKKAISLILLSSIIYVSNIARLMLEYYLVTKGILPWSLAHYPLSLVLGVAGVFLLVIVNDRIMPEFGEYVFSLTKSLRELFLHR
jgi:exosortase/archaeosortase family protein